MSCHSEIAHHIIRLYAFNNVTLCQFEFVKDFGVPFDEKLSFSEQIFLLNSAYKSSGYILLNSKNLLNTDTLNLFNICWL